MSHSALRAISLFSGMGGLDIGARVAGLETALAIDLEADALSLLKGALACSTLEADLGSMSAQEVYERSALSPEEPFVLFGGPPCTGFSHAGFWLDGKRSGSDPAVSLLGRFGRFVRSLKPEAWVLENVPGLTFKNYRTHLEAFRALVDEDYSLFSEILNAAHFGVPQRRRRFFLVGLKGKGRSFRFPDRIFEENDHRTAGWAFSDLDDSNNPEESDEALEGKYARLLPEVPPGDNYLYFTRRRGYPDPQFKWRSRYWSFLKKLSPQEPSNTVPATRVTNNGPFHWHNRHLRIREMARLQGFPDSIDLEPTEQHRTYVGNAVPPMLAAGVFRALLKSLGDPNRQDPIFESGAGSSVPARVLSSEISRRCEYRDLSTPLNEE